MNRKNKIIIGSLIGISFITTLILLYNNRKPKLKIENINWLSQYADIVFGDKKERISPFNSGIITVGKGFNKKYTLTFTPFDKDKVSLKTKLNGNTINERVIEFESRLEYEQ